MGLSSRRVREGDGYYANTRDDVVDALPRPIGAVLDVGCGVGRGRPRAQASGSLAPDPALRSSAEQAELARSGIRARCIAAPVEEAIGRVDGPFDTILCLDVLEHLVDPEQLISVHCTESPLHGARLQVSLAKRSACIARERTSSSRARSATRSGATRDKTHLRWFTRSDIVEGNGALRLDRRSACRIPQLGKSRALARMTRGRSTEFLVAQWYVLGTRTG